MVAGWQGGSERWGVKFEGAKFGEFGVDVEEFRRVEADFWGGAQGVVNSARDSGAEGVLERLAKCGEGLRFRASDWND